MWRDRRRLWIGAGLGALLALAGIYMVLSGAGTGRAMIDEFGATVTPEDVMVAGRRKVGLLVGGAVSIGLGVALTVGCFLVLGRMRDEWEGQRRE